MSVPRAFANQRRSQQGQMHQLWLPSKLTIISYQFDDYLIKMTIISDDAGNLGFAKFVSDSRLSLIDPTQFFSSNF